MSEAKPTYIPTCSADFIPGTSDSSLLPDIRQLATQRGEFVGVKEESQVALGYLMTWSMHAIPYLADPKYKTQRSQLRIQVPDTAPENHEFSSVLGAEILQLLKSDFFQDMFKYFFTNQADSDTWGKGRRPFQIEVYESVMQSLHMVTLSADLFSDAQNDLLPFLHGYGLLQDGEIPDNITELIQTWGRMAEAINLYRVVENWPTNDPNYDLTR